MAYIAPDNNNITFNFEKLGYNSPNSNNTIFSLGVEHSTYQIKSSIVGTLLQRDYLKSKEVNVIVGWLNKYQEGLTKRIGGY